MNLIPWDALDNGELVELHFHAYSAGMRLFRASIDLTDRMSACPDDAVYPQLAADQRVVMAAAREQNDLYDELGAVIRRRSEARKQAHGG